MARGFYICLKHWKSNIVKAEFKFGIVYIKAASLVPQEMINDIPCDLRNRIKNISLFPTFDGYAIRIPPLCL